MKDFAQVIFIVVIIWGCAIAAPIFGLFVGSICAAWFLFYLLQESKNGP